METTIASGNQVVKRMGAVGVPSLIEHSVHLILVMYSVLFFHISFFLKHHSSTTCKILFLHGLGF